MQPHQPHQPQQPYAVLAGRRVPVATLVETVPAEPYRAVVAERDVAESLLAEAEREIVRLRRALLAQGRPSATIGDATGQPDRYVRRLIRDARSAGRLRGEPAVAVLARAVSNTLRFQPIDGASAAGAEGVR